MCIVVRVQRFPQTLQSAAPPPFPAGMISRLWLCFPLQVVLKNEPVHPFGLAVYGDYIFWTDWVRRAVLRADKYTGGDMKVLRADIPQQPMGIVAVANDTNNCEFRQRSENVCLSLCAYCSENGKMNGGLWPFLLFDQVLNGGSNKIHIKDIVSLQ